MEIEKKNFEISNLSRFSILDVYSSEKKKIPTTKYSEKLIIGINGKKKKSKL
jgi:hypothetical protein